MEEVNEKNYIFSSDKITKWLEELKKGNIKVYSLIDTGDVHYLLVDTPYMKKRINRYKELNTIFESDDKEHKSDIIPLAIFVGDSYNKKADLLCRIEIFMLNRVHEYYGIIDLDAFNNVDTIHIYFRDLRFIWMVENTDDSFKPEEIKEKVVYLNNSLSGLSKYYITEDQYDKGLTRIISVESKLKAHSMDIEIAENNFDVNIIINPIYDCSFEVSNDNINIKNTDNSIITMFSNYNTYEKLSSTINNIIYTNLSGKQVE